jgi:hypothetical protein
VVWETEEGWGIRADLAIVEDPVTVGVWEKRVVSGIVEAKVWEIEVLAWVTVGVRGRELELAQAIVEGAVAVGEGVPSKAPVAEAVMCVAPAPAVPQAVAAAVVAPAAAVVAVVVVVVVAVGAGKGLS